MLIDALIPVKAAVGAKGRLAPLLDPIERVRLVRAMLQDVTETLCRSTLLRHVAVTSPDPEIRALAERLGAIRLNEPEGLGLNGGLAFGLRWLCAAGAEGVLIVPADLPAISEDAIAAMLLPAHAGTFVRAAPSHDGGTGALLLIPPHVIAPAFGAGSFACHERAALAAGVRFERRDRPGLAADIDYPEDLLALLAGGGSASPKHQRVVAASKSGAHHTRALLLALGIDRRLANAARPALTRTGPGGPA